MGEQVEVISWLFRLLFISIGLHVLAAGIILLPGRRVPGIQQRDVVKVSTGMAKIVGNTRILGGGLDVYRNARPVLRSDVFNGSVISHSVAPDRKELGCRIFLLFPRVLLFAAT
ncbi:hypothetical protein ACFWOL_08825 [Streptomyces sp. NPDC058442]|uniref:hypothetical protein n=1 Tax=Streptomyces sp. NPDC058442 TaxID=3346503 RepID=UPI00365383D5